MVEHVRSHSQSGCYLDLGAPLSVQATQLTRCDIPYSSPLELLVVVLHNCTAGRCCLYRAMLRAEVPRSLVNWKFVKGWVSNTIARWPSMAPDRGASGRATSVYSTPWPPTCSGALPTWCTIEVALLLAFTVGFAIQNAPGRLRHTCTRQRRGKHTQEAVVSQQWSAGSSSTHSPVSTTCIYLLRGQKVANYHRRATVPCREGLRPGAALLHLWYRRLCSGSKCNMRLDMAVFAWGHMMREQDA